MSGLLVELFPSRTQTSTDNISERSSAELLYMAIGCADEEDVLSTANSGAPATYNGMNRHAIDIIERVNENAWKVAVKYIAPPETVVSFDSTNGTQHITQSIATVGKYGNFSTELGGAIGFDGENVAGVDKVVPVYTWTETHFLTDDDLNIHAYYALTGSVNSDVWNGYQPGEILFLGAAGQEREDGLWEVGFKFSYQPNQTGLSVGSITAIEKKGWEYLWVYYAKSVDVTVKVKIPKPTAVYVEQIYDYAPFSILGI